MFVSYGGITFKVLKTNDHGMEAVSTDDGADYLYTRCRVDVEGLLNPGAMSYLQAGGVPAALPGNLPATSLAAIRHTLMQKRQVLSITDVDGQVLVRSPDFGATEDPVNGPHPISCSVRQVVGSRTWAIRWVCEFALLECPFNPAALISNRWSESHVINQWHLTTRTVQGRMVFRSDILTSQGLVAHQLFDETSIPPVPPGFRRESLDVVAESSGLTLAWRVRDVEQMYDLGESDAREGGSGILKVEGSYGVSTVSAGEGGPMSGASMSQIDIRAYGNKYANQWIMLQRCMALAFSKLGFDSANQVANTGNLLQHAAYRQSLGSDSKWVEVSLAYRHTPPVDNKGKAAGAIRLDGLRRDVQDIFADQGGENPGLPNGGGTRGTALIDALTQVLKDACAQVAYPATSGGSDAGNPPADAGPPPAISVREVDELPDEPDRYSPDPSIPEYPYTQYSGSMTYDMQGGTLALPSTGPPPAENGPGGSGGTGNDPSLGGSTLGNPGGSLPGAGPGSTSWSWPATVIQYASPVATLRVEFQAERAGTPPLLPSLVSTDGNLVPKLYRLRPDMPIVWNDGETVVYRVHGYYEYWMKKAPQPGEALRMGILPWTGIAFTESLLTDENFGTGIFDDPDAPLGGTGSYGTST